MAADRAPFIDHSQALYLYMVKANENNISDMNLFSWKLVSLLNFLINRKINDLIFLRV